jgi:transposase
MNLRKWNSKKKLHKISEDSPEKEIFFFDEARFGTHSKHGLGWFKKGSRTPVLTKLGFKSFYIYSATNHKNGESVTLILPSVNKICMQIFINEFANVVAGDAIIVMDQAGWHKNLVIPSNLEIIFLPPYSPELNPVERLWQHIKDAVLKNKVYDDLNILEDQVVEFVKTISAEIIMSVCNCSYI